MPQDNTTNALLVSRPQLAPQAHVCQRWLRGLGATLQQAWQRCEGLRVRVGASTYTTPASAALYRTDAEELRRSTVENRFIESSLRGCAVGHRLPGRLILLGLRTTGQVGRLKLCRKDRRCSIHQLRGVLVMEVPALACNLAVELCHPLVGQAPAMRERFLGISGAVCGLESRSLCRRKRGLFTCVGSLSRLAMVANVSTPQSKAIVSTPRARTD